VDPTSLVIFLTFKFFSLELCFSIGKPEGKPDEKEKFCPHEINGALGGADFLGLLWRKEGKMNGRFMTG